MSRLGARGQDSQGRHDHQGRQASEGDGQVSRARPGRAFRLVRWLLVSLGILSMAELMAIAARSQLVSRDMRAPISSIPLLIAAALLLMTAWRSTSRVATVKANVLAIAFLAWGLYQLFPGFHYAGDLNDLAILLFSADVIVMVTSRHQAADPL